MGTLIIVFAVLFAIYVLIRSNTKRGAESVRAHIYLGGMEAGASKLEANAVASVNIIDLPSEIIVQAKQRMQQEYGGKQLTMIADAYRAGMISKLPTWQRMLMGF